MPLKYKDKIAHIESAREDIFSQQTIEENPFLSVGGIPLGTIQPFSSYDGNIPPGDIVYLPMTKKEVTPIMVIAIAGYLKTVILKRLIYYHHKANYRVMSFAVKGDDMSLITRPSEGRQLHQDEIPDSIPAACYVPSCINKILEIMPSSIRKRYDVFTLSFQELLDSGNPRKYLASLGLSPSVREKVLGMGKHVQDMEKILKNIGNARMTWTAQESALTRIGNILEDDFFSKEFPKLDLDADWDAKLAVVVSFFEDDTRYIGVIASYLMYKMLNRAMTKDEHKFVVVDDADLLVGSDLDTQDFLSAKVFLASLTKWRWKKFNLCFATQSPDLINPQIIDNCKWFIIGKCGNVDSMNRFFANPEILHAIKNLKYDPNQRIHQYCLVYPDRIRYQTFYPFGSIVRHTW